MKVNTANLKEWGRKWAAWALVCLLLVVGAWQFVEARSERAKMAGENASLGGKLAEALAENERLNQELRDKLYIIETYGGQISEITSQIGNLQKLAETDEELLRKYSKVYFLSENYNPTRLAELDEEYAFAEGQKLLVHADVLPYLESLMQAARADGHDLRVSSAFRSFGEQASLKNGYTVTYGTGANQFSADQGYSEHQLGTTVDFATPKSGRASKAFESDPAYQWLRDNAYRYGVVLSYPKGNAYYIFEPWHWRYVGEKLATYLHNEGKNFYDLDQREIDNYLITLFD